MVSGVLGCDGQRTFAEIGLKVGLTFTEIGFKVGLSMERTMYAFHYENPWFLVSLGARDSHFRGNKT